MNKITPNIDLLSAFICLTCGFTMLAWGTSKLVTRPFRNTPLILIILGAMKVAEGITRFCPLTFLVEERLAEISNETNNTEKQYDELVNPS